MGSPHSFIPFDVTANSARDKSPTFVSSGTDLQSPSKSTKPPAGPRRFWLGRLRKSLTWWVLRVRQPWMIPLHEARFTQPGILCSLGRTTYLSSKTGRPWQICLAPVVHCLLVIDYRSDRYFFGRFSGCAAVVWPSHEEPEILTAGNTKRSRSKIPDLKQGSMEMIMQTA
jgi:hypothetical protein